MRETGAGEHMFRLMNPKLLSDTPPKVGDPPLYFNTFTISRFMRACYGKDAAAQAQRHVIAYALSGRHELAEIWKRVLAHLCGIEIREDGRRVLRKQRNLKVRE